MPKAGHRGPLFLLGMMLWLVCSSRLAAHGLLRHSYRPITTKNMHQRTHRYYMSTNNNIVQSTKSTTVKTIQALLAKRKKRQEMGATVVEGPRMVMDLLENESTRPLVRQVLVSEEDWISQLSNDYPNLWIQQGTPEVLRACSDTVTPQGIVAIVSIPEFQVPREKQQNFHLFLDGVADPGNVGTLLRSSVAVGVSSVVLLPQCCDVWNPKAVRSAMGCTFQVPILNVDSYQEAQSKLGVEHVYAATMVDNESSKKSIPYYDVEWTAAPSALIIGSEGNGLSDAVRKAVLSGDIQATHVPMEAGIESLNAAVCGSVIMFEFLRQCRTKT